MCVHTPTSSTLQGRKEVGTCVGTIGIAKTTDYRTIGSTPGRFLLIERPAKKFFAKSYAKTEIQPGVEANYRT